MEADPTIEFEHFLAAKLGMTVSGMRAEMGSGEFCHWVTYYAREAQRRELADRSAKANQ